jgi:pimeloyl-ACP methyl ester carboxylesterase
MIETIPTSDGVGLWVERIGHGKNIIVVPNALYTEQGLAKLSAADRTMVFYDLRNRGRSGATSDPQLLQRGIENDVDDLETVRRAVAGTARISIIGHSYLGLVAALYARAHQEHIDRIVQIGAMWIDPSEVFAPELTADKDQVPDRSKLKDIERMYKDGLAERDPQSFCEQWWSAMRVTYVTDPGNADQLPRDICAFRNEWPTNQLTYLGSHVMPSIPRLKLKSSDFRNVHVPVLVVQGKRDRVVPFGAGIAWINAWSDARLLAVPEGGHLPWIEDRQLASRIDRFLRAGLQFSLRHPS